jgi:hypothetical protein
VANVPENKPSVGEILKEVDASLQDENAKLLWQLTREWLVQDGEDHLKQQVEAMTKKLSDESLVKFSELMEKIPKE